MLRAAQDKGHEICKLLIIVLFEVPRHILVLLIVELHSFKLSNVVQLKMVPERTNPNRDSLHYMHIAGMHTCPFFFSVQADAEAATIGVVGKSMVVNKHGHISGRDCASCDRFTVSLCHDAGPLLPLSISCCIQRECTRKAFCQIVEGLCDR